MASDKAPSEDNLEPEEIQMVIPEVEDENSPFKKKKTVRRDAPSGTGVAPTLDMTTSISPLRRKGTTVVESANPLKKNNTLVKAPASKNQVQQKSLKKNENTNSKTNIKDEAEKKDEEQELVEPEGLIDPNDDTVTHKKKRKRNVESRDVWTQTDRSDYMLIKYR